MHPVSPRAFGPGDFGIGQLFEEIPDGVVVGNVRTGRIVLWNDAATDIFGHSPDEAVGSSIENLVVEELRPRHRAGVARYARSGRSDLVERASVVELPALHASGQRLWVELRLRRLRVTPDKDPYVLGLIRDVTARHRRLELEREQAAAVQNVLSMAAHDIQSPLAFLNGTINLLRKSPMADDPVASDLLERSQQQIDRLRQLVGEILVTIRLEVGVISPTPTPVLLSEAVHALIDTGHLGVLAEIPAGATVLIDRAHLDRILSNLLSNAEKYGQPPITVRVSQQANLYRVHVEDHGPGVPASFRHQLFQPYARLDAHTATPGSGLGLSTARRLAELNGGRLYLDTSTPYTRFTVELQAHT